MIRVSNLDFEYGPDNGLVLCDLNIDVKHNEIVAILGPNGSGKTTLIKHFNALLTPLSGDILIDGLDTKNRKNHKKIRELVSFVFQNPLDQFIGFTVFEDLAVPLRMSGVPEKEVNSRVEKVLHDFGLTSLKDKYPHDLSGGEQKLVSIASSMVVDPKVIILDEPTIMLDKTNKTVIHDHIKALKNMHKTVVVATTDPDEASLTDKVYVIKNGKIVKYGEPREVFNDAKQMDEIGVGVPKNV